MFELFKRWIKRYTFTVALIYILYNVRIRWKLAFGSINTSSGTTHAELSIEESIHYIEGVFHDYQKVSGRHMWRGRVAELGPGDNAGVASLFLAHGAEQVDLADRFYSKRNNSQQKNIHQALQNRWPTLPNITEDGSISGIERFYGESASGENFFLHHKGYDTIISRSVLEHVDQPELVLRRMFDALNPGGQLIHKVDLRDHGMMTPYAHDIKWFEIPECLLRMMVDKSGYPNRFLFHEYKRVLQDITLNSRFYVAGLFGVGTLDTFYAPDDLPQHLKKQALDHIQKYRNKFARYLRHVPGEDLMVSSFFFVCSKP